MKTSFVHDRSLSEQSQLGVISGLLSLEQFSRNSLTCPKIFLFTLPLLLLSFILYVIGMLLLLMILEVVLVSFGLYIID
ncbi:unnamed protein product [Schistosoma mattheei]|uniref:Uncharacterized protein n=1 Tax=Schistosoma mattheei TaxID=31246 RepID=A0A3P8KBG5_9TREM|nr:unnamed protein product [Schistosoma mattheei]